MARECSRYVKTDRTLTTLNTNRTVSLPTIDTDLLDFGTHIVSQRRATGSSRTDGILKMRNRQNGTSKQAVTNVTENVVDARLRMSMNLPVRRLPTAKETTLLGEPQHAKFVVTFIHRYSRRQLVADISDSYRPDR